MDVSHLLGLIVPAISTLFCLMFCALWYKRKTLRYLLFVSLSFGAFGLGFTLKQFLFDHDSLLGISIAAGCYSAAICLLIGAAGLRRHIKSQKTGLILLGIFGASAIIISAIFQDDLSIRSMLHNCILGSLFLLGGIPLSKVENPDALDRILLWILIFTGLIFGLFSLSVLGTPSGLTPSSYYSSTYWFLMNISLVIILTALAMALFAMTAVDLMKKIQVDADEDYLSGLLVRSAFTRKVSAMDAKASSGGGVILFDLDHFKRINDTYGHTVGDNVIRAIGKLVTNHAPMNSICGRLGGEEFGIIMPDAPLADTQQFAENLRTTIPTLDIEGLPANERVSASFGVTLHTYQDAFELAYKNADNALYSAKQSGRNQVHLAMKDDT